ncbi:J domain-containing protein [Mycena indigotica]|uniref:J domain-containing protein n=1 Tax=Mycena indigotica TaxID=2126181 RepID=A0A8H6VQ35_9AGAR|nr:J domain-containing protein [Mycena indigotica]KAF7289922.1 J domain-containing protein [Mycena indigotica]
MIITHSLIPFCDIATFNHVTTYCALKVIPPRVFISNVDSKMNGDRYSLYAVLNLPIAATDQEIHERHRALSLTFHPDKHPNDEDKRLATEKFLELQKAYEVLSDPFLRRVYDLLGPPGLLINWMEEDRTKSAAELQTIFNQLRQEWMTNQVDLNVAPKGQATCSVDATSLFSDYLGLENDPWPTRLRNRLEDVRLLRFTLRHDMRRRIAERWTVGLAARISRQANGGRGNFIGTLRHQYSPRISFKATSTLLFPREINLCAKYQSDYGSASVEASIFPAHSLFPPTTLISLSRKLSRRPDAMQGNLKVDIAHSPQVSISLTSRDRLEMEVNRPDDPYTSLFPLSRVSQATSFGIVLDSNYPKLFAECGVTLAQLSSQCKLGLEFGLGGFAWSLGGGWASRYATLGANLRLSEFGVAIVIDGSYMQQGLSLPVFLSHHYDLTLALWVAAFPSAACLAVYRLTIRRFRRQRQREITAALQTLEPGSPKRRDAEAVISFLKDRARDSRKVEASKGGLVVLEATYGAIDTAERNLGLFWDITIPLQTLVRASQVYIPGRHPKSRIQGFLDPAPFTVKSIRALYLFRGKTHYVEIPEYISLVLPLQGK